MEVKASNAVAAGHQDTMHLQPHTLVSANDANYPEGPYTQQLGTWVLVNSNFIAGFVRGPFWLQGRALRKTTRP